MLKNKDFPIYTERTNKHLIFGHINVQQLNPNVSVGDEIDESYITINPNNVNDVYKIKPKSFNFYNKFSKISGKKINSLVNKFEFNLIDLDNFKINVVNSTDTSVDMRCYDIINFLFTNDITKYNLVKKYNKWIDDVKDLLVIKNYKENGGISYIDKETKEEYKIVVRIDCFDLNLMGGTGGIVFGHDENRLPTFMTERATEYITSNKIIVKSGTLEKRMSGISKINFGQIPVSMFKDWLLVGNECTFDTKSLIMRYNLESNKKNPNGITIVEFRFVPIDADSFYKNVSMFEAQNKFFKWAINSAKNDESKSNAMNNIVGIPMRLSKIVVINNDVREEEISANNITQFIVNSLNFGDKFTISDKLSENSNKKITYLFTNDKNHDPDGATECLFKAYL